MSSIARWSYRNTAKVQPFISIDEWSGEIVYGDEYTIKCSWIAESSQQRDQLGAEFVSRHIIYTEDERPQYLDLIQLGDQWEWQEIRSRTEWEMKAFDDISDFKLIT